MNPNNEIQIQMPSDVAAIINTLTESGFEAYAVGGCVRDALLGRVPHDWDITTSAKPEQVKSLFTRTIDTGIQHGTVTIMIGKEGYEVTTYRIDGVYEDARHPKEVSFTSDLLEDLKRRDFTINAMAYNDRDGIVDAFGGVQDLQDRIIRCVGNPMDRFSEDALRMMRAVRFAAQLGFTIDPGTKEAVKALAPNLAKVSAERIHTELTKMLTSNHPEEIRTAWELGLTAVFFPEFDEMMNTPQNNVNHCFSVGEHSVESMRYVPADRTLRFAMLFHDIAKPQTKSTDAKGQDHFYGHPDKSADMAEVIMRRWKMDNELINTSGALIRWHDYRPNLSEKSMRKLMNKMGSDLVLPLIMVKRADIAAQSDYRKEEKLAYADEMELFFHRVKEQNQCVQLKDMEISGKDLIAMGLRPGKQIGAILQDLFEMILDDPQKNQKEFLRNYVRTHYLKQE